MSASPTNVNPVAPQPVPSSQPSQAVSNIDSCALTIFHEAQRIVRKRGGVKYRADEVALIAEETQKELKKKESPCLQAGDAVIRALSVAGILAPLEEGTLVKERAGFVMKNPNIIADVIFDYKERKLKFAVWNGTKMKLHSVYPINGKDDDAGYYVLPNDPFDTAECKIVLLPTGVQRYGSTAQLIEKMRRFIRDFHREDQRESHFLVGIFFACS